MSKARVFKLGGAWFALCPAPCGEWLIADTWAGAMLQAQFNTAFHGEGAS